MTTKKETMGNNLIINVDSDDQNAINTLITQLQRLGKKVVFVRSTDHLDIDTPHKDSYELFAAGLDFAMLVTDKQRYLKSHHDVSRYLPVAAGDEWVIQDSEVYPSDTQLSLAANHVKNEAGDVFSLDDVSTLITWLEACHERKNEGRE